MREPNAGAYVYCSICGKRFWTEDGFGICSEKCEQKMEEYDE